MNTPAVHRCSWSLGVADQCRQLEGCCQEQLCFQDWVMAATQVRERDSLQLQERGLSQEQVGGLWRLHQKMGPPEALLVPLGSAHMLFDSSHQWGIPGQP